MWSRWCCWKMQSSLWRALHWGTKAGFVALPPNSMVDRRPSSRSSTSSGGPLQPRAGARHSPFSKWFVPGEAEMASAVDFSSERRAHRANFSPISALCAWRSPAHGGDGSQALDCFSFLVARGLCANFVACNSNSRFLRAVDEKGQRCNFYTHRQ
jgi:hypothetical protein